MYYNKHSRSNSYLRFTPFMHRQGRTVLSCRKIGPDSNHSHYIAFLIDINFFGCGVSWQARHPHDVPRNWD